MLRVLAIALSLAALSTPAFAGDGDPVNVTITVVHAKPADGGVAPELAPLGHYLVKAFPTYKSFARLSFQTTRLDVGGEGRLTLPNHNELVYKHTGWKDGFAAIHLDVGGLSTTVNVKDGGTFFQAGRGYDGGMIVLAFEVASAH